MLEHVVHLIHFVGLLDVNAALMLRVQVDHVLCLLWSADEATLDGLLLEVHSKGVELHRPIRGQPDINKRAALAQEVLGPSYQWASLSVDDDLVDTRVRIIKAVAQLLGNLVLGLIAVDDVGFVWSEVRWNVVGERDNYQYIRSNRVNSF